MLHCINDKAATATRLRSMRASRVKGVLVLLLCASSRYPPTPGHAGRSHLKTLAALSRIRALAVV